jgi:preprotein translocase subunit YajC
MDFFISSAYAQAAGEAQPSMMQPILLLLIFFAIFYFIAIRPQMKRQKEHRAMVAAVQRGDEVVTNGGILGKVEDVGESFVTVEVADGVKVKLQKFAIAAVLPKGTLKSS